MNIEILQMQNELARLRRHESDLQIKASGAILLIRTYLSPFGEDHVMRADTEKAAAQAQQLHEFKLDLVKTRQEIIKLEEELGLK